MAQISIGDLTGSAQIDISNDNSLAAKNQLSALTTAASDLIAALPKPVTDPTFSDDHFATVFENPSIPLKGNAVDAKASVNSTLAVARHSDSPLFGQDDYDPIDIAPNECWVSFELDTLLSATVAVPLPDGFGVTFGASTAPSFATYVRIPAAQAPGTTLEQAIAQALGAFNILDSSADVLSIPQDVVYTNDVSGTIKVGGAWSLPLAVNQLSLADAKLPFNQSISVSPALTLGVSGDVGLTSEFNVRFRRSAPDMLRIGVYLKKGTTFEASFTASAALEANAGNTDLIDEFFTAVAPGIDTNSLQPGDAAKIKQVLSDSLNRSLAISLNAGFSETLSDEAAVVYDVDISVVNQATRDGIDAALHGDWTAISKLPNARKIRNAIIDSVEKKSTFTVNFLGLYNYRSIADFVRTMKVIANQEDGSVTITDSVTAKHIVTASTPLAADADKLRAALYEGFVATATYKALLTGMGTNPVFGATQDLLIYHDSMAYRDALKQLNAGEVLDVMPAGVKTALPPTGGRVGHARFAATRTYSNDDVLRFFFSDIEAFTPRKVADLKKHGRIVLASLLDPQDPTDQKRIAALGNDTQWAAWDANPSQVPLAFYPDWYDISEWGPAIADVGPLLAGTIQFAKTVQGDPTANPAFMKKRAALALALDSATHNTHAAFDQAFPICVMSTLAGLTPGATPPVFEAGWDGKTVFSNKPAPQTAATQGA